MRWLCLDEPGPVLPEQIRKPRPLHFVRRERRRRVHVGVAVQAPQPHELGLLDEFLQRPHNEARHLDAQIGWDPQLRSSSYHGVTTALIGKWGLGELGAGLVRRATDEPSLSARDPDVEDASRGIDHLRGADGDEHIAIAEELTEEGLVLRYGFYYGPGTWYAKDGTIVCHFQPAQKFKTRYATFGFSDKANLDEGAMWPTAFALRELTAAEEEKIGALVKKAVS